MNGATQDNEDVVEVADSDPDTDDDGDPTTGKKYAPASTTCSDGEY